MGTTQSTKATETETTESENKQQEQQVIPFESVDRHATDDANQKMAKDILQS